MTDHVDNVLALAALEIAPRICSWVGCDGDDAPGTLEEVIAFHEKFGCLGVSNFYDDTRLFGSLEACQAFDAWHDHCHFRLRASFDLAGEILVNDCQQSQLRSWYKKSRRPVSPRAFARAAIMLEMNNVGRLKHWLFHHNPPDNPRSFAQGYLAAQGFAEQPRMCDLVEVPDQYPQEARERLLVRGNPGAWRRFLG